MYDKYHDNYIRENPNNPDEEDLADQLAEQEIKGFMERLRTKNFTRRVFQKLGPRMIDAFKEQSPPVDETPIDTSPVIAKTKDSLL
jgi:hypothetical protein